MSCDVAALLLMIKLQATLLKKIVDPPMVTAGFGEYDKKMELMAEIEEKIKKCEEPLEPLTVPPPLVGSELCWPGPTGTYFCLRH
jgi:hypothetical protein